MFGNCHYSCRYVITSPAVCELPEGRCSSGLWRQHAAWSVVNAAQMETFPRAGHRSKGSATMRLVTSGNSAKCRVVIVSPACLSAPIFAASLLPALSAQCFIAPGKQTPSLSLEPPFAALENKDDVTRPSPGLPGVEIT